MTTIKFRSPVTLPLLRKGTPKPAPPDPRAYETFRVTQQFNDVDAFHQDGRKHNATDIGNYTCGSALVAMATGTVRRVQDNAKALGALTDALGVIVDHGHGITTEIWHLNGYAGPSSGPVAAGQQIGVVGRTGLGNVCHAHVEAKRNGVKFDPEPLMFGGSVTVEDDMQIPGGLKPLAQGVVGTGNRLRVDVSTTEGSKVLDKAYWVQVYGFGVPGAPYTLGGKAGNLYAWVGVFGTTWFVAEPLLTQVTPTGALTLPTPDCSAQEATIAQLNTKIARARTANSGATQAQQAVEVALR